MPKPVGANAMFGTKAVPASILASRARQAFLDHRAIDPGARALGAYDEFLGLLDGQGFRDELRDVTRTTADKSNAFAEVRRLGRELEAGLLALLFETNSLPKVVRDYAIF